MRCDVDGIDPGSHSTRAPGARPRSCGTTGMRTAGQVIIMNEHFKGRLLLFLSQLTQHSLVWSGLDQVRSGTAPCSHRQPRPCPANSLSWFVCASVVVCS